MSRWVPRFVKTVVLAAIAAVVAVWFRNRADEIVDEPAPGSAQWPPLVPIAEAEAEAAGAVPLITEPSDGAPAEPVGVPEGQTWRAPTADGACPPGFPVKAKQRSGIYHVDGGLAYERTVPDRCYATAADAEADGFRASKM